VCQKCAYKWKAVQTANCGTAELQSAYLCVCFRYLLNHTCFKWASVCFVVCCWLHASCRTLGCSSVCLMEMWFYDLFSLSPLFIHTLFHSPLLSLVRFALSPTQSIPEYCCRNGNCNMSVQVGRSAGLTLLTGYGERSVELKEAASPVWGPAATLVYKSVLRIYSHSLRAIYIYLYLYRSRGSSVSIMSDYRLDDWVSGVRSPAEAKDFSSNLCVQTSSEAHPASCTMGTGGPFPGGKSRPGCDSDNSL
jgi:hypothetical protein